MKKRIFSIVITLLLTVSLLPFSALSASGAEPQTFCVKYNPQIGEWRVQQGSSWDSSAETGNLDYLWGELEDGDSVIILGDENSPAFGDLKIEKRLNRLTLDSLSCGIIVYAQQKISVIYVCGNTAASLNGLYDTIHVYDSSSCNINNDVKNLYVHGGNDAKMNVTTLGKVDCCVIDDGRNVITKMYNVSPGTLKIADGENKTDAANYSPKENDPEFEDAPAVTDTDNGNEENIFDRIVSFFKNILKYLEPVKNFIFERLQPLVSALQSLFAQQV